MVIKNSRRGPFLACSGYPKCKNAKPVPEELKAKLPKAAPRPPPEPTNEKCEKCGSPMLKRQGRYGPFLGCSAYPKCKTIQKIVAACPFGAWRARLLTSRRRERLAGTLALQRPAQRRMGWWTR